MIKVIRARNPRIALFMQFFGDEDSTEEEDRQGLIEVMTNEPDKVCVVVGFRDGEVVCHVCGKKEKDYVWVYNAWSKIEKRYSGECFEMVKNWAKNENITKLRCETFYSPKVMKRAFGWERYSTIMELDLGIVQ